MFFFNFPEKLCYFIGCNFQSRASHLGECIVQVAADSCHMDAFRRSLKYFFGTINLPFSSPRNVFIPAMSQMAVTMWLLESKNQQQSRVFFDVIFDAYNYVDNRERARASDCKQKRCRNFVGRKTWKFGSGGEKMRNAGGQQGAAMSGSKENWKRSGTAEMSYNNSSSKSV